MYRTKLYTLYHEESFYWKQRSKQQWLEEGNTNTKYFHKIASHRHKQSKILKIKVNDHITENIEEIHRHISSFYKELLGKPGYI